MSTVTQPDKNDVSSGQLKPARGIRPKTPVAKGSLLMVVLVFAAAAPFLVSQFQIFNLTGVLAYGVAALGLNLITGYVGEISLGHNLFFAVGAYSAALGTKFLGINMYLSVLFAAVVCFVVGILAGFPAQRVKGLYLVLITLALAVSVAPLIKNFKGVTGGAQGLVLGRPQSPTSLLSQDSWTYYVVLSFTIVSFWLIRNLISGRVGRALAGVREAELSSVAMGVNASRYKVLIFGVGSMLGGIGGALLNFSIGYIAPDSFTLTLSIAFLAAIVVGGLGTITGALIAGAFVQYVPSIAAQISQSFSGAVYGLILILCMIVMPKGVVGSLISWRRLLAERAAAKTT